LAFYESIPAHTHIHIHVSFYMYVCVYLFICVYARVKLEVYRNFAAVISHWFGFANKLQMTL